MSEPAPGVGERPMDPLDHKLSELVDAQSLQTMMDDFSAITSIPMALLGVDGTVVVGAGWQDVCTKFHRVHPETCAHCVESDTVLTAGIPEGEARLYECKNGMWDACTPIVVGDRHIANLFTGQFFFDDEPVDLEFFRRQAARYGFDEEAYLAAVQAVPRLSRETVATGLRFLTRLSSMISQLSYSNLERCRVEEELRVALQGETELSDRLAAEQGTLRAIMGNTQTHLAYLDPDFNVVAVNAAYAAGSGKSEDELLGKNHFELFPNAENQQIFEGVRESRKPVSFQAKPFEFADQPWRGVTYWDWQLTPVEDEDGELQGFAFSLQNVTDNVRSQAFSDAINGLNDVIHAGLDFDSLLRQFVPELARAAGCEFVIIALRSQEGRWHLRETYGARPEIKERSYSDAEFPRLVESLESGKPILIETTDPGRKMPGLAALLNAKSALITPLRVGDQAFGVMACGYYTGPGTFGHEHVDFACKVAASLSLALQNTRLFEAEKRARQAECERAGRLELVHEITSIAVSSLDVHDSANRVLEALESHFGLAFASILVADSERGVLTQAGSVGYPEDFLSRITPPSLDSVYESMRVYSDGVPIAVEDAATADVPDISHTVFDRLEAITGKRVRSYLIVPLESYQGIVGSLNLFWDEPRTFASGDIDFFSSVAHEIAVGLENARLFDNEQRRRERLEVLHGVMETAVASLNVREAAQGMLDYLSQHHDFEISNLWLARGRSLDLVGCTNCPEDFESQLSPMSLADPYEACKVFASGNSIVVHNAEETNPEAVERTARLGLKIGSYAVVPVRSRGETIGTLNFAWSEPRHIAAEDVRFYLSLGQELGVVLENARLYEAQHNIADRLQEALLAVPAEVNGIEFAHAYHSASESSRVGGDFYDLFELEGDRIGVVIGDVAGKGLDAAVLTSLVKNTIRAHASEPGKTPDHILELTNDLIYRSTPNEAFVTVFFAIIDLRGGRIVFSSAGHTPGVLICKDGSAELLRATGPLLGAFPDIRFGERAAPVAHGDLLFLYTDGLTEARRNAEMYGDDRLVAHLRTTGTEPVTEVVRDVIGEVVSFSDGHLSDDVAIVAVRIDGQVGQERLEV